MNKNYYASQQKHTVLLNIFSERNSAKVSSITLKGFTSITYCVFVIFFFLSIEMSYISCIVLKCCLVGRLILHVIMRIKTDRELITRPTRNLRAQSSRIQTTIIRKLLHIPLSLLVVHLLIHLMLANSAVLSAVYHITFCRIPQIMPQNEEKRLQISSGVCQIAISISVMSLPHLISTTNYKTINKSHYLSGDSSI